MIDPVAAFLHRRPLRRIRGKLATGETVQAASPGHHDGQDGTVVLTNRRMFWVPERGRLRVRRRGPMHDVRMGDRSGIVDANKPSFRIADAPAASARDVARASWEPERDRSEGRRERVERLFAQGRITEDEYRWMLRDA